MKLNVAYPATGAQKMIEIDDERKMNIFYEKRMAAEINADPLGEEWKGYVLKISGGNDKQGFPMKQGVLTNGRVRLLLSKGHTCYRPRRKGERKRKSVRGCIVDSNLSVLSLVILKKGEKDIPGLTDKQIPRRLGPKRANKIRKLFNLTKEDDVRQYVIKRPLPIKEGAKSTKPRFKAPKIQRLVTPSRIQRKRREMAEKRHRATRREAEAAEYERMLQTIRREKMARRKTEHDSRKRRRTATTTESDKEASSHMSKRKIVSEAEKSKKQETTEKKQTLTEKKPTTTEKKPTTSEKKATTDKKQVPAKSSVPAGGKVKKAKGKK
ncbi:unnamed protein product [Gordionus sp. m RMFG-2023]|uniref:small ribosomal subunit protein eS6-like n=1 Tax=Gordionus sp. m RMFG-2023 TaxID=3053472 RepID=UPI0030DE6B52